MIRLVKNGVMMFSVRAHSRFLPRRRQKVLSVSLRTFQQVLLSSTCLARVARKWVNGSGVVVAAGTVVTNCHVTDEAAFLQVRWNDEVHLAAFVVSPYRSRLVHRKRARPRTLPRSALGATPERQNRQSSVRRRCAPRSGTYDERRNRIWPSAYRRHSCHSNERRNISRIKRRGTIQRRCPAYRHHYLVNKGITKLELRPLGGLDSRTAI